MKPTEKGRHESVESAPASNGREAVSIEELAFRLGLERLGKWFNGPCPWEGPEDKDSSFCLYPDGGFFCLNCRRSGDAADLRDAFLTGEHSIELPEERNGHGDPVGVLLKDVQPERIDWVWRGRIPKRRLALVDGNPGEGKSVLSTDLAARKSVGHPWPDGEPCEAGGVVICSAEDGLSDTIRPRLDAAGGDPSRVLALTTVKDRNGERLISIPEDLPIIRQGIERVAAELVIVDPLMAFLSGAHNAHKDQDVRRALAPLAKLAEETGAAVVVIRHLNKASGGDPLYRGGGSIGIIGAARSALLVARHPEDERRRVLAPLKSNLAEPAPSLAFTLTEAADGAVRVEWKGETALSAAALLAAPTDPEERSALDEAMEFLRDALGSGPVWSKQVKKDAREADISEITLRRAKGALGVRSEKQGDGSWAWVLPEGDHEPYISEDDPLDPLPIDKRNSLDHQEDHDDLLTVQEDHSRGSYDPLEESPIDKRDSGPRQGQGDHVDHVLGDDPLETCIHGTVGGCWLCNPDKGGAA